MTPDEDVFVPKYFTHNRERLVERGLKQRFFDGVVRQAIDAWLAINEHFAVDGSLIQGRASIKSLNRSARAGDEDGDGDGDGHGNDDPIPSGGPRKRSRSEPVDFRGQTRVNDTHRSATDPESRLSKSSEAGAFLPHSRRALKETRNGLLGPGRCTRLIASPVATIDSRRRNRDTDALATSRGPRARPLFRVTPVPNGSGIAGKLRPPTSLEVREKKAQVADEPLAYALPRAARST